MCVAFATVLAARVIFIFACNTSKYKLVYTMDDDRPSVQKLEIFNYNDLEKVELGQMNWIDEVKRTLKLQDFSKAIFMPPRKEVACEWVLEAVNVIKSQSEKITQLKDIVDAFKTDILADKAKIIRLQDKLLENKDDQIENLESSVEKTVHNTVERGIKSYSEAVSKLGFEGPIVTFEKLKLAVKVRLRRRIEAEP